MKQLAMCTVLTVAMLPRAEDGKFEHLATFNGLGLLVASTVGRGLPEGSERWYGSYMYYQNTLEVVSVDPSTGSADVFSNPTTTEYGARCITTGPDGKVYLGTLPGAHLLQLDIKSRKLIDLGRPSPTEQYIWDVTFGSDRKLYGATYPHSKLVRYDPVTGQLEDLGRMDNVEQYAHYLAASGDGFVYIGIGTSRQNIVAYEIATGEHRSILPPEYQIPGQATVETGSDGKVYGLAASHAFRLEGWVATPIPTAPSPMPKTRLNDSSTISVDGRMLHVIDRSGKTRDLNFAYSGNKVSIFRLGVGPDHAVYASTVLPIHLLRFDEKSQTLHELGDLGAGEIYSFAAKDDRLLAAAYGAVAPLISVDTSKAFQAGTNPTLVKYQGADSNWRPLALIRGPGGKMYAGAVAGYGQLSGTLTTWDITTNRVEQIKPIIIDQGVSTLVPWRDFIIGGTTIEGGGGSHPSQKEARLFMWDPKAQKVLFDTVPLPGVPTLNDFVLTPDGLLFGVGGKTFFTFDPETRIVKTRQTLPVSSTIYNAATVGPDGRIWGLSAAGIFAVDPTKAEAALVATAPSPITAGFALLENAIYFAHGSELYRYRLPAK